MLNGTLARTLPSKRPSVGWGLTLRPVRSCVQRAQFTKLLGIEAEFRRRDHSSGGTSRKHANLLAVQPAGCGSSDWTSAAGVSRTNYNGTSGARSARKEPRIARGTL